MPCFIVRQYFMQKTVFISEILKETMQNSYFDLLVKRIWSGFFFGNTSKWRFALFDIDIWLGFNRKSKLDYLDSLTNDVEMALEG